MKPPKRQTLRRYGLTQDDWIEIYDRQGGKCPICKRSDVRLVIDHMHVLNYRNLPAKEKARHVRGLLCVFCNLRVVNRNITLQRATALVVYLEDFQRRLNEKETA